VPVLIGTSGWQYRLWRERFYPRDVAQKRWLEFYAERFRTVESNNAFYMLPKPETFKSWAERTPDDFVMTVKVNRYITHIRRLRVAGESVSRFLESVRHLGPKLGPVLLQLPPTLRADMASLADVLERLSASVRVAVEFRHASWFNDEVRSLLRAQGAALCIADRASRPVSPLWRTADWGYVRFHQGTASPLPCYGRTALRTWVRRVAELWGPDEEVYAFFNNDFEGCALRDARVFAAECARAGLAPTRVSPDPVPVG
jgi:uncharacterized protein YecE (DUF72 family)